MASIEANRAAGKAAIEAGTLVPAKPPSEPSSSPSLPLNPYPATPNSFQLCPLPAISVQQPDQQRQWQSGAVPQTRLIPVPATSNPQVAAQSASVIQVIKNTVAGSGLLLQTNNKNNANQAILDLVQGANVTLSANAQGQITISSTASSASVPQWPLPNTAVVFMSRAIVGTTSLQTIGDASTQTQSAGTGALSGAGTLPTASEGVFQQITTGAGTGNALFTWFPVNSKIFRAGRNNKYQARSRFPTAGDISASQVWCGFSDQSDLRPTIGVVNVAAILSDFGVWKGIIYNAGALTSIVLTGTPDTATHSFEIDMNDTANTTTFMIDGSVAGTISGKNPSGLNWFPLFSLMNKTSGGTTANVNFQYMYAQQDF